MRRVLALVGTPASAVERFIHGTTVATNAVLEQKSAVTAVLTTEGFEDVLKLGRQKPECETASRLTGAGASSLLH